MSEHRIISMQCGDNESYALLFRRGSERAVLEIYDANSKELVQTLQTPFPADGIDSIRSVQSFDVTFFAQPNTRPCKLVRKDKEGGGYEFSFEDNEFLPEPTLEWEMNSEHDINVFAIPDADIVKTAEDGTLYYPKGVLRENENKEEVSISHSYHTGGLEYDYDLSSFAYETYGWISVYGFAQTTNSSGYQIGKSYPIGEIDITVSPTEDFYSLRIVKAEEIDGAAAEYTNPTSTYAGLSASVKFKFARVERLGSDGVYFYLGRVFCRSDGATSAPKGVFTSGTSIATVTVPYGDPEFFVTLLDTQVDTPISNEVYYKRAVGSGFDVAMTIDGSNTNENLNIGQTIALKHKSLLSVSDTWNYDALPVGTTHSVVPVVDVLHPLPSKLDSENNELRPASGGGYGNASEMYPVRGTVDLKTEGVWSGVIELQEIDKEQSVSTIARITSENGLSNTSLSRDIEDFGSSVRVVCTRREKAYQINKSVNSDGGVISKVLYCDEGCQWTLTSAEEQTAHLRIKEKRTLSDGTKCYIAEVVGGINKSFSTSSYALGAWSEKNGYPGHVAIYQERLVYAGNKAKPVTLWMSKTNGWDDFELGPDSTSSITATLATDKYDKIQWILPNKNGILVGTQYSEFSLGGGDGGVATADNITATMTSGIGSSSVGADTFGTATIMVKTGGTELYRIDYNTLSEESAGNQISLLASHLFEEDPVVDMFSIKAPSNMLFCLHESGKISSLTYEPEYGVTGWAQHHILDGVDSGCVLRNNGKDILCLVVRSSGKHILGELDLSGNVWTDDGEEYESYMMTTPMRHGKNTSGYGKQQIISGCDIYVGKGTKQFNLRLRGGDWVRVDNGRGDDNELRDFDAQRIEIPATSSWADEATVEIKSTSPSPVVIHAVGASIND